MVFLKRSRVFRNEKKKVLFKAIFNSLAYILIV